MHKTLSFEELSNMIQENEMFTKEDYQTLISDKMSGMNVYKFIISDFEYGCLSGIDVYGKNYPGGRKQLEKDIIDEYMISAGKEERPTFEELMTSLKEHSYRCPSNRALVVAFMDVVNQVFIHAKSHDDQFMLEDLKGLLFPWRYDHSASVISWVDEVPGEVLNRIDDLFSSKSDYVYDTLVLFNVDMMISFGMHEYSPCEQPMRRKLLRESRKVKVRE